MKNIKQIKDTNCHKCGSLFTLENAKFPVYKEGKKTNYCICSECKFRS